MSNSDFTETYHGKRLIDVDKLKREVEAIKTELERLRRIENQRGTQRLIRELEEAKRKLDAEYIEPSH